MKKIDAVTRYVALLAVMAVIHTFLNGAYLILAWTLTGLALALIRWKYRFLFLYIILAEILIGIYYFGFRWNGSGQLDNIAHNISCSVWALAAVIIFLNMITTFLMILSSFLLTKLFRDKIFKKYLS